MEADTIPDNPRVLDESSESSGAELNDHEGEDENDDYFLPRGGEGEGGRGGSLAPEVASSFALVESQMEAIQVEDKLELGEWEGNENTSYIKDIVSKIRAERRNTAKIYRAPRLRRKDRSTKRPWSVRETHAGLDIEAENEVARSNDKKVKKRKRHHSKRKESEGEGGGKRIRQDVGRIPEDTQNHPLSLPPEPEQDPQRRDEERPCRLSASALREFGLL